MNRQPSLLHLATLTLLANLDRFDGEQLESLPVDIKQIILSTFHCAWTALDEVEGRNYASFCFDHQINGMAADDPFLKALPLEQEGKGKENKKKKKEIGRAHV